MTLSAFAPTAFPAVGCSSVPPPLIWALTGEKVGDNAQVLTLATALGWRTEIKRLRYRPRGRHAFPLTSDRNFSFDRSASSTITPPWPDLVIGCGRRSAAVALEIRAHAGPSTRLVQLGRPRTDLDAFDLVVTTPQYRLPRHSRVMHISLPMHGVDRAAREREAALWRPRLVSLPRPWIGVLLGGATRPYLYSLDFARRMARQLNGLAGEESASLLVTTSRRTPIRIRARARQRARGAIVRSSLGSRRRDESLPGVLGSRRRVRRHR